MRTQRFSECRYHVIHRCEIKKCLNMPGHLSNVQNPVDIPWNTGCLIGTLVIAYYNPHITGQFVIPSIQQLSRGPWSLLVCWLQPGHEFQPFQPSFVSSPAPVWIEDMWVWQDSGLSIRCIQSKMKPYEAIWNETYLSIQFLSMLYLQYVLLIQPNY